MIVSKWTTFVSGLFATVLAGAEAPSIGTVSTEVASRTASYLSGTVSVEVSDLGGAESVDVAVTARPQLNRNPSDTTFSLPVRTGTASVSETGTCAVALAGLIPGRTYDLEVMATGAEGDVVTNTSSLVVPSGWSKMCYKPDSGKSFYPWTNSGKWFSSPTSSTVLDYLPSLGDSVFLYSSKNVAVPLTVASGVVAEMNELGFCSKAYANRQWFQVCGTVTNVGKVVVGDSSSTSEKCAADLVVENGGEWTLWSHFILGCSPNAFSTLEVKSGGRFVMPTEDNGESNLSEFIVGDVASTAGASFVTNNGEMVVWDLFVGNAGEGRIDNWGAMTVNRKFTIGRNVGGRGVFHLHKGAQLTKKYIRGKNLLIGFKSEGSLILDDDLALQTGDTVTLGDQPNAVGHLELNESATLTCPGGVYVGAGLAATGTVEMTGTSRIVGAGGDFAIGQGTNAAGRATLSDSSRLEGFAKLLIGVTSGATGLLQLRGGEVSLPGGGGGVWSLYIGSDGASTKGVVRGWGNFLQSTQTLRLTPFGQIVADGEGEMRDLDFGWFRTVGTSATGQPNTCGTNGWYAVNKGRLRYPHQQDNSQTKYRISGDYPYRTAPTLVNSFAFDLTGRTEGKFLHADLYASDREDIPAGLGSVLTGHTNRIAGVLHAGYFTTTVSSNATVATKSDFTSGTISWRYDQTGLDPEWTVMIYRHDGTDTGAWQRVYRGAFDAATTVLTTDAFTCSADAWNLGWFAVVATKGSRGTILVIR